MNATNQQLVIATVATAVLLAFMPLANADEVTTLVSAQGAACGTPGYTQMQDLKLATKAQEGVDAFVKHVQQTKLIQQWSIEEALVRARAAAITPCAVAMGLNPIDEKKFATALVANSR